MSERNIVDHLADAMYERAQTIDYGLRHRESPYWTELADAAAKVTIERQTTGGVRRVVGVIADHHPEVACISGSMRNFRHMLEVAGELTAQGVIVLAPFVTVHESEQDGDAKKALDELHFRKIDMSDRLVVVSDESGYYGDSTRAEIAYAERLGELPIEYRKVTLDDAVPQQPRDGVYVRLTDKPVAKTWEPFEGVNVDMDAEQHPVGFEFLAAKSVELDGWTVLDDPAAAERMAQAMYERHLSSFPDGPQTPWDTPGLGAVREHWSGFARAALAALRERA